MQARIFGNRCRSGAKRYINAVSGHVCRAVVGACIDLKLGVISISAKSGLTLIRTRLLGLLVLPDNLRSSSAVVSSKRRAPPS